VKANVGGMDRNVRLAAGAALAGGALLAPVDGRARALMGLGAAAALGTALSRRCMANSALGIDTAAQDIPYRQIDAVEEGASAAGIVTG
jgi:hypothetical protein